MALSVGALQPAAKNVSAWQAYNRRRWAFEKEVLQPDERMPFVCECAAPTCVWAVELTLQEYESAHMCDQWTAVIPGHVAEDEGVRVVLRHPHFWVVELALPAGRQ
jgi:hypothetical protein